MRRVSYRVTNATMLPKLFFGALPAGGGGDDIEVTVVKEVVELTPAQIKKAVKMKKRAERARQPRASTT